MKKLTAKEQKQLVFECFRSVDDLYVQYAKDSGLSYIGLTVLEIIYMNPENCTQKFICEQTCLPKQSVNTVIKHFWEQRFVELREIPSDRRNKTIHLSPEGQEYADKLIGGLEKAEDRAMDSLTCEERDVLLKAIHQYEKEFRKIVQPNTDDAHH